MNLKVTGSSSNTAKSDEVLLNRVLDSYDRCVNNNVCKFMGFFEQREQTVIESFLKSRKINNFSFFGGFIDAQRKMLGFFPEDIEMLEANFPIFSCTFTYRKIDKLTHRDFLGCLMGLKIKREIVGDIVVNDGKTVIFLSSDVFMPLILDTQKVGRVGVSVSLGNSGEVKNEFEFKEITGTVASMRFDSIVSLMLNCSREQAVKLIKSGIVSINHIPKLSVSLIINESDTISIKGTGRFIIDNVGNVTKKGRIHVLVKKYI